MVNWLLTKINDFDNALLELFIEHYSQDFDDTSIIKTIRTCSTVVEKRD